MAQRRMISLDVIDTDAFLEMSVSAQLLYFHLNARADDDGFISNPKRIMRAIGTNEDDFKLLVIKKFVIYFDGGICVIKHWRINNFVRKDIYKETKYTNLKRTLFIRENGAYTLNNNGDAVPVPDGHFRLDDISVNAPLTLRQPSIGKDSIDKNKEELDLPEWLDKKAWNEWVEYRKQIKKKLTALTIKKQIKFLSENKKDHIKILENSISNGWTGLFQLKKEISNKRDEPLIFPNESGLLARKFTIKKGKDGRDIAVAE